MAAAEARRPPALANLPVEPAAWHLGGRPLRGAYPELPDPLHVLPDPPPAAGADSIQRHRPSNRPPDLAPDPGGDALGPAARITDPRPTCPFLRGARAPRLA